VRRQIGEAAGVLYGDLGVVRELEQALLAMAEAARRPDG
jgi:hypothetical protein